MDYYSDPTLESAVFWAAYGTSMLLTALVVFAISVIANWKIFSKAGEEGWKSLIPFYNLYILSKIATGNGWMGLLLLVPIVNIFVGIYLYYKLSQSFGQGVGFTLGLIFLNTIFLLILAFGSYKYYGPNGEGEETI